MPYLISTKLNSPFLSIAYFALFLSTCPAIHKPETKATGCDSMHTICLPQHLQPATSLHLHTSQPKSAS